jgi:hypothetical protein
MLGNLGATQDGEPNSNKVGWTNHNPNFKMLHLTTELWALHIYYQKTMGTTYLYQKTMGTAYSLPKSYENYRVYRVYGDFQSLLMHLAGKVRNVTLLAAGTKHVAFLINGSRGGITTNLQVSHSTY